jgi:hypothetical protein
MRWPGPDLGCSAKTKRKNILKWTIVIGKFDEELFAGFALERFPIQISASFTHILLKLFIGATFARLDQTQNYSFF